MAMTNTETSSSGEPCVGVIGAGIMGSGIAQSLATAGFETHCFPFRVTQIASPSQSWRRVPAGADRRDHDIPGALKYVVPRFDVSREAF